MYGIRYGGGTFVAVFNRLMCTLGIKRVLYTVLKVCSNTIGEMKKGVWTSDGLHSEGKDASIGFKIVRGVDWAYTFNIAIFIQS